MPKPNKLREQWDGPRVTPDAAKELCGADHVFFNDELPKKLGELLRGHHSLVYGLGQSAHNPTVLGAVTRAARIAGRGNAIYPTRIVSLAETIGEMRLKKTPLEIERMKAAAAVSVKAHEHAMKVARVGQFEYTLDAALSVTFRKENGVPAYENIVASGPNATYLHYRANNRQIEAGDLILIDAGCELATYASDITHTFPVSGRFSEPQRVVYQKVLDVQTECIAEAKAGVTIEDLQQVAVRIFTDALISWGVLKGPASDVIAHNEYKRYYPHRIGHWLGLDVHDAGHYMLFDDAAPKGARHRPLEDGHVFTIEPGLYFPPDDESVPVDLRGIGVRIEDDIAITGSGREVLTGALIRQIADIERFMARTSA
jgi:Xaa-Pro aminopeptidase